MDVSVIVCPRNRAAGLARTLESLTRASAGWAMKRELVVVDNGSRDGSERPRLWLQVVQTIDSRLAVT